MSDNAYSKYPIKVFNRGIQETQKWKGLKGDVPAQLYCVF